MYCDYFIWRVSCIVVVLNRFLMYGCVYLCVCVGFVMCGCFGNMCTCIYCVLYCVYSAFYCFAYVYLFVSVLSVLL